MTRYTIACLVNVILGVGAAMPAIAGSLQLEDAWVRALPPVQRNTAAYLVLHNRSDQPVSIRGGRSPVAGRVEVHRTREIDGYTRMEQLDVLILGPGERLELAPGGTHLMLLDLERMPEAGERVELCLDYGQDESACTRAEVRRGEPGDHQHHH